MEIYANILEDSIGVDGERLTTLEICLPKCLLAEFNTHRVFSRNFSSSRAIPVNRVNAIENVFIPLMYGENQSGMQAKDVEIEGAEEAHKIWMDAIEYCRNAAKRLNELKLHKQWANRVTDWSAMAVGVVSATEFGNFFNLRDHRDAQPEMALLAVKARTAMENSTPKKLSFGEWHLPYITDDDRAAFPMEDLIRISAARCCRVSYLNHDGKKSTYADDMTLFNRLAGSFPPHMSPLEHQAMYVGRNMQCFNLRGFASHRWMFETNMLANCIGKLESR